MKIYVVTAEDLTIDFGTAGYAVAFSSKEKAEEYIKNNSENKHYGYFTIDECTLDDDKSIACSWHYEW